MRPVEAPSGEGLFVDNRRSGRERLTELADRWLPLTLGGLALLVFGLWYWNPLYRYDEYLVAVGRTSLSWQELLHVITTTDPAPGPFYLVMKPWVAVSSDSWWTRIPSLIAMAVAVGGLVAFARGTVGRWTAVGAGLLLIALPGASRWAQDNRMYALATAFVVLAVLCWWRSLHSERRLWSVAYGAAVVGMGLSHLYALSVVPALVLTALWVPGSRRSHLLRTIVPPAVASVVLLPHVYLNLAHPTGSPTNPPVSTRTLIKIATRSFGHWMSVAVALLAAGGTILAWRIPERRPVVVLGVAWVLVPLACFVLARGLLDMPTLSSRYFVFALPGACLVAALGLSALAGRSRVAGVVALIVVVALVLPPQVRVRSEGAHSPSLLRLRVLLHRPELAGLPVVTAAPAAVTMVGAAMYPDRVLVSPDATPQPVAIVVGPRYLPEGQAGSPYVREDGGWATAITCRQNRSPNVHIIVAPGATVPGGNPEALAETLTQTVRGYRCAVPPS